MYNITEESVRISKSPKDLAVLMISVWTVPVKWCAEEAILQWAEARMSVSQQRLSLTPVQNEGSGDERRSQVLLRYPAGRLDPVSGLDVIT